MEIAARTAAVPRRSPRVSPAAIAVATVATLLAVYTVVLGMVGPMDHVPGMLGMLCTLGSTAGVVLVFTVFATGESRGIMSDGVRATVALLSMGAALIHFVVVGEHAQEWWAIAAFFVASGALQLIWALLILVRGSRRLYLAGAVGNVLIVALWAHSRTFGLPIGPEAGEPEAITFVDVLATVYEAVLVIGATMLLTTRFSRRARTGRAVASLALATVLVVPLTALALFQALG